MNTLMKLRTKFNSFERLPTDHWDSLDRALPTKGDEVLVILSVPFHYRLTSSIYNDSTNDSFYEAIWHLLPEYLNDTFRAPLHLEKTI